MKIIRVSGCHDCPHYSLASELCNLLWGTDILNATIKDNKTFPDNCPLEEEGELKGQFKHNDQRRSRCGNE